MPIDSEVHVFGIRVEKQELPPGVVFHIDKYAMYGTEDYTWYEKRHERIQVLSSETLLIETEYLTGRRDPNMRTIRQENINRDPITVPTRIPGGVRTLVYRAPEEKDLR